MYILYTYHYLRLAILHPFTPNGFVWFSGFTEDEEQKDSAAMDRIVEINTSE
jgi:hypothetical protein